MIGWERALKRAAFVALIVAVQIGGPAEAGSINRKTKITYYNVEGSTYAELMLSIHINAPRHEGNVALAMLKSNIKPDFVPASGNQCKLRDIKFNLNNEMVLPRLRDAQHLPGKMRRRFDAFQAAVRRHEEEHAKIYYGCISRLRHDILSLPGSPDCDTYQQQIIALIKAARATCDVQNDALDKRDGQRVTKLPIIQDALQDASNGKVPKQLLIKLRTTSLRSDFRGMTGVLIDHSRDRH